MQKGEWNSLFAGPALRHSVDFCIVDWVLCYFGFWHTHHLSLRVMSSIKSYSQSSKEPLSQHAASFHLSL